MSSNSVRSSSLPPYAAPAIHGLDAQSVAPAVLFVPFVPPTWLASLDAAETVSESFSESFGSSVGESLGESVSEFVDESGNESGTESSTVTGDDTLPWIEAFALDPQEEHESTHEQSATNEPSPSNASAVAPSSDALDDTWVMNEASADIAQLADELSAVSAEASTSATAPAAEPHLPWQEDEAWMDIMPALPNSGGRDLAAETEWARAFGEPPAPMLPPPLPTGDAQAAAASLESIARRLRAGELNVPGFQAARGDAAALAAALAALLGAND